MVDVVYLDFRKAFDKIYHKIFLNKVVNIAVVNKLFKIVKFFKQTENKQCELNSPPTCPRCE